MGKFNHKGCSAAPGPAMSPIVTRPGPPDTFTFEGAAAFTRTPQSELFMLAVNHMGGEDAFYESGKDRDLRFSRELVHAVAAAEPVWMAGFLPWLRGSAHMRTTSVMGAADAAAAMIAAGVPGSRALIHGVLQRADEPGELAAYWRATYGRQMPKPVKAGINDALVGGLWNEYALLKYDTGLGLRFGDILSLTRPVPATPEQDALWRYALLRAAGDRGRDYRFDAPYDRDFAVPRWRVRDPMELLPMVRAQAALRRRAAEEGPGVLCDAGAVRAAGLTHEDVMSLAGKLPGGDRLRPRLWAALIPSMGYMALLRNLRRFDEDGIGDDAAQMVADRLGDPERVARSKQFPYRFLAAFEQAHGLRWGVPLERALTASLANLPVWEGRTLILVDTSASMVTHRLSQRSTMTAQRVAAVFGVALALRNPGAELYGFANPTPFRHEVRAGMSLLREIDRFNARNGEAGHGTDIAGSVRAAYAGHDRVVVISDMQTIGGPYGLPFPGSGVLPPHVPLYGFSLGGYRPSPMPTGRQWHEFGGLTDATFAMVPTLEAGLRASWPWEAPPV